MFIPVIAILIVEFGLLIGGPVAFILYLNTQYQALTHCAPENRTMPPGLVWLQLVPLAGLVWQFFVVRAMRASLANQWHSRGLPEGIASRIDVGPTKAVVDLVASVLLISGVILLPDPGSPGASGSAEHIAYVLMLAGFAALLASLTLFIIYWSHVAAKAKLLRQVPVAERG